MIEISDEEIWKQEWIGDDLFQISSWGRVKDSDDNFVELYESKRGYMIIPTYSSKGIVKRLITKLFLPKIKDPDKAWYLADGNIRNLHLSNFVLKNTNRRLNLALVETKDKIINEKYAEKIKAKTGQVPKHYARFDKDQK